MSTAVPLETSGILLRRSNRRSLISLILNLAWSCSPPQSLPITSCVTLATLKSQVMSLFTSPALWSSACAEKSETSGRARSEVSRSAEPR